MRGKMNIQRIGKMTALAALMALTMANRNALAAGEGHGQGRGGRMMHRALGSLNLTEDQKTKIHAIADQQKGDMQAFHEQMRADHEALKSAMSAATPDPTAVGQAFLKVHADRQMVKTKLQDFRTKIAPILTPDQNSRLEGYLSAMRPMHGGHGQGPDGPMESFR